MGRTRLLVRVLAPEESVAVQVAERGDGQKERRERDRGTEAGRPQEVADHVREEEGWRSTDERSRDGMPQRYPGEPTDETDDVVGQARDEKEDEQRESGVSTVDRIEPLEGPS
jgi:hypothetical protein